MKRRKPHRLKGFDYSRQNYYFVTSCTKNREHFFGKVINKNMQLNDKGIVARDQWIWLTNRYDYVISHAFVVMPNHIHGILEINSIAVSKKSDVNHDAIDDPVVVGTGRDIDDVGTTGRNDDVVGTGRDLSLPPDQRHQRHQQRPNPKPDKIKSLSELMGAYKTTVSKKIHLTGFRQFAWHRSFHDHIIRNNESFKMIKHYIESTPAKWPADNLNDG